MSNFNEIIKKQIIEAINSDELKGLEIKPHKKERKKDIYIITTSYPSYSVVYGLNEKIKDEIIEYAISNNIELSIFN